ncbi:MAG: hypothetical protein LBQ02_03830 [Candidatus Nomurabacteria bacterium]|nr:hypothetical protein [Candidatus Nomurabacteria bacterium]
MGRSYFSGFCHLKIASCPIRSRSERTVCEGGGGPVGGRSGRRGRGFLRPAGGQGRTQRTGGQGWTQRTE